MANLSGNPSLIDLAGPDGKIQTTSVSQNMPKLLPYFKNVLLYLKDIGAKYNLPQGGAASGLRGPKEDFDEVLNLKGLTNISL